MISAILLLTAHLFADFHLQGSHISKSKCDLTDYMMIHCLLYAGIMTLALNLIGFGWWVFVPLVISHWIIDDLAGCKHKLTLFQDQVWHLLVILILMLLEVLCI